MTDFTTSLDQLVNATASICTPPLIYNRLSEAISHPNTSIKDIAQILAEDPGLSARLLKLANSPLYGCFNVDSIQRAVTLIGTREIRDLTLAATVLTSFPGIPPKLLNMPLHWRHSLACGVVARNIAFYLREPIIERFFVAGILHDIGQLVLCSLLPDMVLRILDETNSKRQFLGKTEQQLLGFNHGTLGGALLNSWKIPANIVEPVTFHHNPSQAPRYPRDAAIIHLADISCQALGYISNAEVFLTPLDTAAYEQVPLTETALETILHQSDIQLSEIFALLPGDA